MGLFVNKERDRQFESKSLIRSWAARFFEQPRQNCGQMRRRSRQRVSVCYTNPNPSDSCVRSVRRQELKLACFSLREGARSGPAGRTQVAKLLEHSNPLIDY